MALNYDPNLPVYAGPKAQPKPTADIEQRDVSEYVDPATATVEGRVGGLLAGGAALPELAKSDMAREYQARGLLSSGGAATGGTLAAMREARQIATPDAALYGDLSKSKQQAAQESALNRQKAELDIGYETGRSALESARDIQRQGAQAELAKQQYGFNLGLVQESQKNLIQEINTRHGNTLAMLEKDYGFKFDMQDQMNTFNQEIAQMGFDQQNTQALSSIFGSLVDTQLASAGRVMATPDATWTQNMQDDMEGMINASKEWLAGLFKIDLA